MTSIQIKVLHEQTCKLKIKVDKWKLTLNTTVKYRWNCCPTGQRKSKKMSQETSFPNETSHSLQTVYKNLDHRVNRIKLELTLSGRRNNKAQSCWWQKTKHLLIVMIISHYLGWKQDPSVLLFLLLLWYITTGRAFSLQETCKTSWTWMNYILPYRDYLHVSKLTCCWISSLDSRPNLGQDTTLTVTPSLFTWVYI